MVEGHGPVEICERGLESLGNGSQRLFAQIAVTIVEGMEQRKERSGLVLPTGDQGLIVVLVGHFGFEFEKGCVEKLAVSLRVVQFKSLWFRPKTGCLLEWVLGLIGRLA